MEGLAAEAWTEWEQATPSCSSSASQSTFLGSKVHLTRHVGKTQHPGGKGESKSVLSWQGEEWSLALTLRLCSIAVSRERSLRASALSITDHGNPRCGLFSV